ncbi:sulfatase [Lacibacter sp.]|uniref:sulfatase family protein n=1 Tax=Lacibacter sp. TaxID=1915409 RepID=UPI002B4AF427|nr:sulfatase [Lacibacter sp.]HLP37630.1 sulfatase [Lacibacter sp.]
MKMKTCLIVFLSICTVVSTYAQKKRKKPNVIYVMTDQLRYDMLGYSGSTTAITPNLDRLASQGLNFTNCVSGTPVCTAHRASVITGKYASSTGVVVNELRINPNHETLPKVLMQNGYKTGFIGKWHLWANIEGGHDGSANNYVPPGPYRLGFDGEWKAYNFHHLNFNSEYWDAPEAKKYPTDYEPEAQFNFASDFINRHKSDKNPFALFLWIGLPHDPWRKNNVPEKYYNRFVNTQFHLPPNWRDQPDPYMDRNTDPQEWLNFWKPGLPEMMRVYYAMVNSVDELMGNLMKQLDEQGLTENTILIFSSDHGEMFGENGRVYKMIFYESSARIPFLIRWPGKIPAGLKSDALINTPDFMPTILGLTGLPVPSTVEGMDVSKTCLGKASDEPEFAFLQGMGHTYQWLDGFEWRAVRDKRFTFARYLKDGKELLFDNKLDPQQITNLINDIKYTAVAKKLREKMQRKMIELNDEFKPCTWYRDNWTDGNRNIIASAKGKF